MGEKNSIEKDKVHTLRGYFLYSLGAVPSALPYNMIGTFFVFFYTVYAGLSLELTGLVLILYGIWNAVNDPLLGYYMDKKVTKWGRRIPYILVGTIPFTIGFIFLWYVPWTEEIFIFMHALLMLFLFDFGFTLAVTSWAALYTEMYESEEERATTVAIKDTIAFISSLSGILFPPLIASFIGWQFTGVIIGIFIPITMYLSLLGTKERPEYQIDEPLPMVTAFKEAINNKPFLIITLTYTMIDFCFGLTLLALPLYANFVLNLDESLVGFGAAGIALGILLSVPFWKWIYAKKGPKYGLMLGMLIFALGIWPVIFINNFVVLIVITIIPGFGAGGMLMTEPAISTAIDFDELRIGTRREATYTGILTLIARLSIVFSGITLILVQLIFGFDSNAASQSMMALFGLTILVSIIPLLGLILGIIIFSFFPINYEKFRVMQNDLKLKHELRLQEVKKS
ncbi:MAG: MFS transporter [Candidatus Lokiarchaeota archaeon]|nr:MFS transporter [Candidatus Lokiarchaeota archaeon]MBD3341863.1 MFS transporter [Candidatus Lokiarchaeota archaeon]